MADEVVILVSCPPSEADALAKKLIEERLAACVSVVPSIVSTYRWKDEICCDNESLLLIKANKAVWNGLESRIKQLHSYEVPEILCLSVESGHQPYLDWLNSQIESPVR